MNEKTDAVTAAWQALKTVIDPELNIDIVSLGLVYSVSLIPNPAFPEDSSKQLLHIVMTLTTPGCPLAGTFDQMVRSSLRGMVTQLDVDQDVRIELTFDPPWTPDMMSEEAKAELGF